MSRNSRQARNEMKPIRIKPELLSLLISIGKDSFSASDLTKAYRALPNSSTLSPRAINQYVRRNVSRLEQKGMLVRIPGSKSSRTRFRLTDKFKPDYYLVSEPLCPPSQNQLEVENDFTDGLRKKLHHYKLELLTAMGEVEEYDDITKQMPLKRALIQDLYNETRDHCSKLLGRIRAIESIISKV